MCERFYSRLDEEWKVLEKRDQTKGNELRVVNGARLGEACCDSSWGPSVLETGCSFPLGGGGGCTSHMRPLQQVKGEGQRILAARAMFKFPPI